MLPANQCLDANDQPAAEIDQRLVVKHEFVLIQCPAQVAFHQQALERRLVHFGRVKLESIAPKFLGLVHRHIGIPEQGIDIPAILRENADSQ